MANDGLLDLFAFAGDHLKLLAAELDGRRLGLDLRG